MDQKLWGLAFAAVIVGMLAAGGIGNSQITGFAAKENSEIVYTCCQGLISYKEVIRDGKYTDGCNDDFPIRISRFIGCNSHSYDMCLPGTDDAACCRSWCTKRGVSYSRTVGGKCYCRN